MAWGDAGSWAAVGQWSCSIPRAELVHIKDPRGPLTDFSAEAARTLEELLFFHSEKNTPGKGFVNEL